MNRSVNLQAIALHYLKYFLLSLILVFLMVFLQNFRIFSHPLEISPNFQKTDIFDTVQAKLSQKPVSGFQLKNQNFITQVNAAQDYDDASAYAVIDFNSGDIITQKNLNKRLPIASLTKIMTAVVALDLASPQDILTASQEATKQIPTKLGLVEGEKLTLEEALNGLMLVSANDTAKLIEEGINQKYTGQIFVKAMNEKAKLIGLKNSHFENPMGLDDGDPYSSVEDLAILTKYALTNYPLLAQIVKKDYQFYPANQNHQQIDMYNWNGLLGVYPGVLGVKIGNTDDAGYTTVVLSERAGEKVLAIILGAPTVKQRDLWAAELLDLGFVKLGLSAANINESQLKAKYASWKYW